MEKYTWEHMSAELQRNGTPVSALGYCMIAFSKGRETAANEAIAICAPVPLNGQWCRDAIRAHFKA